MKLAAGHGYLIAGAVAALAGLSHWVTVSGEGGVLQRVAIALMTELFPVSAAVAAWRLRQRTPPLTHWILAPLVTATLLYWALVHGAVALFDIASDVVSDPAQYEKYREHGMAPELVAHFPPRIPAGATEVSFFHQPKFLQGAGVLQLRFQVSAAEYAVHERMARSRVTAIDSKLDDAARAANIWRPPSMMPTLEQAPADLDPSFEVYYFNPPVDNGDWNHPAFWGIALSARDHEVLFWAEDW